MRMVIQRVTQASVSVDNETIGEIQAGLMVLVGFGPEDSISTVEAGIERILNMRIFSDANGRFMHSLRDLQGGLLLIPQFTLFANASKGRRPEFSGALEPIAAKALFSDALEFAKRNHSGAVAGGEFGADMQVTLTNDGPVTIVHGW